MPLLLLAPFPFPPCHACFLVPLHIIIPLPPTPTVDTRRILHRVLQGLDGVNMFVHHRYDAHHGMCLQDPACLLVNMTDIPRHPRLIIITLHRNIYLKVRN